LRIRGRHAGALPLLVLVLIVHLGLPGPTAAAAPALLEDLHYQLAALVWPDAARVRLTLQPLSPGRFMAEAIGEPQGFIKVLTGGRRERLQTEMVWRDHRLLPLVYREESRRRGKRHLKEYRFDYARGRLELWQWKEGKGLVKKWQTVLQEPVYDPLTAFYNVRLGIMGPTREGETSTIPGIPYPRAEAMEVRLGPESAEGRKAMVSLINPVFEGSRGTVFVYVDARLVPQKVWTTVSGITINGRMRPESVMLPAGLKELPGTAPATSP
jgi:hypothetical protein